MSPVRKDQGAEPIRGVWFRCLCARGRFSPRPFRLWLLGHPCSVRDLRCLLVCLVCCSAPRCPSRTKRTPSPRHPFERRSPGVSPPRRSASHPPSRITVATDMDRGPVHGALHCRIWLLRDQGRASGAAAQLTAGAPRSGLVPRPARTPAARGPPICASRLAGWYAGLRPAGGQLERPARPPAHSPVPFTVAAGCSLRVIA